MANEAENTRVQQLVVSADGELFADGIRIPLRFGKNGGSLTILGVKDNPSAPEDGDDTVRDITLTTGGTVVLKDENGERSFTGFADVSLTVKATKIEG